MKTVVFFEKNGHKCKVLLSWGLLLSRLGSLMVTIELTSSECDFANKLHCLIDVFEPILSKNIVYLVKLP